MGKTPLVIPQPTRLPAVRVTRHLQARVQRAASQSEQPMTGWIRLAILEKLEREGK